MFKRVVDLTPSCKEGDGQDTKDGRVAMVLVEAMDAHAHQGRQDLAEEDAHIVHEVVEREVSRQLLGLLRQAELLRAQRGHACARGAVADGYAQQGTYD